MTNEKQNEVMAIADGFTAHEYKLYASGFGSSVPDYDSDNEIDRMVRGLDDKELRAYYFHLSEVMGINKYEAHLMLKATTAQKKEAFIKCKGEWE